MGTRTSHVILGVTASIAIHRALDVASELRKKGATVSVVMTPNAARLIQPITFQSMAHGAVYVDPFEVVPDFDHGHIRLAQDGDIFVVVPATAGTIGKMAHGIADNLVTTTAIAFDGPKLFAPAMNHRMWANPLVASNVARLQDLEWSLIPPQTGDLACGEEGPGRLAEVSTILSAIEGSLSV